MEPNLCLLDVIKVPDGCLHCPLCVSFQVANQPGKSRSTRGTWDLKLLQWAQDATSLTVMGT